MSSHLTEYQRNCDWARGLSALYSTLRPRVTSVLDLSDILRASYVFSVSAFDAFVHDLVLVGMGEMFEGMRRKTDSFRHQRRNAADKFGVSRSQLSKEQFLFYVRERNALISFQSIRNIANAVRSIKTTEVWKAVAMKRCIPENTLTGQFEVIIQRRNIIVHQADTMPVLAGVRNPIDVKQVQAGYDFLVELAEDINFVSAA